MRGNIIVFNDMICKYQWIIYIIAFSGVDYIINYYYIINTGVSKFNLPTFDLFCFWFPRMLV